MGICVGLVEPIHDGLRQLRAEEVFHTVGRFVEVIEGESHVGVEVAFPGAVSPHQGAPLDDSLRRQAKSSTRYGDHVLPSQDSNREPASGGASVWPGLSGEGRPFPFSPWQVTQSVW